MKRRIGGLLGTVFLSAVAVLGSGSVAQAQQADADLAKLHCTNWTFCLFQHDAYRGDSARIFLENVPNLAASDYRFDNKASSMSNNTGYSVTLYQYKNYGGTRYVARKQSEDKDFTNNHFDNKASSVKFQF
ncbi:peptidase inhibitor family I36 protein [Streptomyces qinglanensis]|uniref:Peptidase inhibitor family I36 n=1 Tax=Streptomyces qinglanensis TaxID=943816 RepID=A0A1H9SAF6_9ACTN|nr:peptidase inhibitor family I36 protein [Streptomyces qinglanensis]SER81982.1 Peptidase inhibitor family I36 [Streptomyces qinglanensis]